MFKYFRYCALFWLDAIANEEIFCLWSNVLSHSCKRLCKWVIYCFIMIRYVTLDYFMKLCNYNLWYFMSFYFVCSIFWSVSLYDAVLTVVFFFALLSTYCRFKSCCLPEICLHNVPDLNSMHVLTNQLKDVIIMLSQIDRSYSTAITGHDDKLVCMLIDNSVKNALIFSAISQESS